MGKVKQLLVDEAGEPKGTIVDVEDAEGKHREEILTYNEALDLVASQEDETIFSEESQDPEALHGFKRIVSHQGPLHPKHPEYRGSKYNLEIEWNNGEHTIEPLNQMIEDDPITVAAYGR